MSSFSHSNATQNFRPEYPVRTDDHQRAQYQRDQFNYAQVPHDIRQGIYQHAERVDRRWRQWEQTHVERESAWEATKIARAERRDRTNPDIQYLRNKKNREEHALARLDHAQRDYAAELERAGGHVSTLNNIQRNRIPEASNYTAPAEIQNDIGNHADYRPVALPSAREYWQPKR